MSSDAIRNYAVAFAPLMAIALGVADAWHFHAFAYDNELIWGGFAAYGFHYVYRAGLTTTPEVSK